jgi:hypothetical protein
MSNIDQELEELVALCEEYDYWANQGTEFDTYGDNAVEADYV